MMTSNQQKSSRRKQLPPVNSTVQAPHTQLMSTSKNVKSGGSLQYTKERLKAALQQQKLSSASQKQERLLPEPAASQKQERLPPEPIVILKQEPEEMYSNPMDFSSFGTSSGSDDFPEDCSNSDDILPLDGIPLIYDEAEMRRQRFMERNKAAAAKCREKKKKWVTNLERKAEEMSRINVKLMTENMSLKGEVAHLKTLMMQHKDCPITLQQRAQGLLTPQPYGAERIQDNSAEATDNPENSDSQNYFTEKQSASSTAIDYDSQFASLLGLKQTNIQSNTAFETPRS